MADEPRLAQGSQDTEWVRYLQQTLEQYGYDVGDDGTSGNFGADTDAAVRQFQEVNVDAYGRQLAVDGVVSARTWSCLTMATEIEGESKDQPHEEWIDVAAGDTGGQAPEHPADDVPDPYEPEDLIVEPNELLGERWEYDQPLNLAQEADEKRLWAACCAMLLDTDTDDIINRVGSDGSDEPEALTIAAQLDLQVVYTPGQDPGAWYRMLTGSGPVIVIKPKRSIVIAGIRSDADGTELHVYDPALAETWLGFDDVSNSHEIDTDGAVDFLTR